MTKYMVDLKASPFFLSDKDITWVEETIESMTIEEKIGQLFCPIGVIDDEDYLKNMAKKHIGGILFRAMPSEKVQKAHRILQDSSKIPMLLAANVETGGDGIASDGTGFGEQMNVAATDDESFAYSLGEIAAKEGAAVGLNWAFGPIIDLDLNYRNPITNVRTFGSDISRVIKMAKQTKRGLCENGLKTCIKHFPGDGVDDRDHHLLTSVNSLSKTEWYGSFGRVYKELIDDGVLSVMAGHITLPALQTEDLPASLSKQLLQGLLREKLGFNGLIITDATPMVGFCCAMERRKSVPYSIEAGCDMFLFNKDIDEDFEYMKKGIESGILSEQRLYDALTRILGMKAAMKLHTKKENNTLVPNEDALDIIGCKHHIKMAQELADKSITLVKNKENLLPISKEKHERILLEVLGDFDSNNRVLNTTKQRLEQEGFNVTIYEPENFQTLDNNIQRFRGKYDLVIYLGNIENVSNKTVGRIHWHTFFGTGNNIPWFVKEVPTLFIGIGNPYLMQDVPMIDTFINAYFNSDIILHSVFDKLLGKSEFKGKSPIDPYCGKL